MHPCPRSSEGVSYWRDDNTCSYCGSLSPDLLFKAIEAGYTLDPTDKNYKVYVHRPNPKVGKPRIISSANYKFSDKAVYLTKQNLRNVCAGFHPDDLEYARKWYIDHWVEIGQHSSMQQDKFYFQHLTEDERIKFIDLYNAKKIKLGFPGRFYVAPFFAKKI